MRGVREQRFVWGRNMTRHENGLDGVLGFIPDHSCLLGDMYFSSFATE
jgi:hypothetical protein